MFCLESVGVVISFRIRVYMDGMTLSDDYYHADVAAPLHLISGHQLIKFGQSHGVRYVPPGLYPIGTILPLVNLSRSCLLLTRLEGAHYGPFYMWRQGDVDFENEEVFYRLMKHGSLPHPVISLLPSDIRHTGHSADSYDLLPFFGGDMTYG